MNSVMKTAWASCFLFCVFFCVQPASSQTRLVFGKIIDKKNTTPIPDAIVSISSQDAAVSSDENGEFKINIPSAFACTLVVAKNGYGKLYFPVEVNATTDFFEIALSRSSLIELQDMDVNANRVEVKPMIKTSEKISQVKMSPELVAKLPNVGQADLFRSLQLLPGVSSANEASSGLYIRGGTPDQTLIVLDHMPIYYVDHFYGFFSAFNPRAIDEVTLYKGGFGSQFGGRLSSVVEMSSVGTNMVYDSNETGIRAGIGSGLLSSNAFVQIPILNKNVGTLMIAGRRSMTDIVSTDLFSRLFNRMRGIDSIKTQSATGYQGPRGWLPQERLVYEPQFHFWDVNGLAAFNLGAHGKLIATFFESRDYQDNSIDTAWSWSPIANLEQDWTTMDTLRWDTIKTNAALKTNAPVSWGNFCLGQQWEQKWSDAYKTRLQVSYSQFLDEKTLDYLRTDVRSHRYTDTTAPIDSLFKVLLWMNSKNKIMDLSGKFDNTIKVSENHTINAGVELSQKTVTYERDTTPEDTNSATYQYGFRTPSPAVYSYDTGVSTAIYAEDEIRLGDKAGLTPGLRYYYFQLAAASALDPRISGWYKLSPELMFKAGWGIYTQEIHRAEEENITGGSKFVWLLTNSKRPLEKSRQLIGGASWETEHFLLDAEAYIKSMSGLLTISERMRYEVQWGHPFDPQELPLFQGTGMAKGVELLAQVKNACFSLFTKNTTYNGWAAYTWSRVENSYDVYNGGKAFPATQDHTHEVKLVSTLEWDVASWSSIDLGAVWMYATGAPYTATLGFYSLTFFDNQGNGQLYMNVSDRNAYRIPDYHRLDLSATWKLRFGKHIQSSLTVGLFNAYNRENILERTFSTQDVFVNHGNSGGKGKDGGDEDPKPWEGDKSATIVKMDKKAMSIVPNGAFEITAKF
jgi:ferric enterobactin receptor